MAAYRVFLSIILFVALFKGTRGEEECKKKYIAGFTDRVGSCPDYKNDVVEVEMKLAKSSDGETDSMMLTGSINCKDEIGSGYKVGIDIAKETDVGSEPMWSCTMDLCSAMEDEDSPLASMMAAANMTNCPVAVAEYPVKEMMIDLGFTGDYLNHEWEGEYCGMMKLCDSQMNTVACHEISFAIKEVEDC